MGDLKTILMQTLLLIIPMIAALSFHEAAHGYAAYLLGDDTPKRAGRLTLNPVRHLDPLGTLLILLVRFGWAKPVPINMSRFKRPKLDTALTALAGPAANLVLVILSVLFLNIFWVLSLRLPVEGIWTSVFEVLKSMCYLGAILNGGLMFFNLLPVAPLDGSKVLAILLPGKVYFRYMKYEAYGMYVLLAVILIGRISDFDLLSFLSVWAQALTGAVDSVISIPFNLLAGVS